jgi:hypothetical protein
MKFLLGQVVMTPAVQPVLEANNMQWIDLLGRHSSGDWGALDEEDRQANEDALVHGGRLLSSYLLPITKEKVWIITEHDRSATTLLLPSEY